MSPNTVTSLIVTKTALGSTLDKPSGEYAHCWAASIWKRLAMLLVDCPCSHKSPNGSLLSSKHAGLLYQQDVKELYWQLL
mmetsp:Transcript_155500/g.275822  ORF Transcript_155500/g.275822 Transcript_155500/m.275822 type:complete len:80 (-) Transcript_155500:393-632(-)